MLSTPPAFVLSQDQTLHKKQNKIADSPKQAHKPRPHRPGAPPRPHTGDTTTQSSSTRTIKQSTTTPTPRTHTHTGTRTREKHNHRTHTTRPGSRQQHYTPTPHPHNPHPRDPHHTPHSTTPQTSLKDHRTTQHPRPPQQKPPQTRPTTPPPDAPAIDSPQRTRLPGRAKHNQHTTNTPPPDSFDPQRPQLSQKNANEPATCKRHAPANPRRAGEYDRHRQAHHMQARTRRPATCQQPRQEIFAFSHQNAEETRQEVFTWHGRPERLAKRLSMARTAGKTRHASASQRPHHASADSPHVARLAKPRAVSKPNGPPSDAQT